MTPGAVNTMRSSSGTWSTMSAGASSSEPTTAMMSMPAFSAVSNAGPNTASATSVDNSGAMMMLTSSLTISSNASANAVWFAPAASACAYTLREPLRYASSSDRRRFTGLAGAGAPGGRANAAFAVAKSPNNDVSPSTTADVPTIPMLPVDTAAAPISPSDCTLT